MRLALQALFGAQDNQTDEGRRRCERIEREIRNNERSGSFLRKLRRVVSDPRLKAPEIFADESFPDANIVAEYLDCQSESEEIRDEYEDVCAESPEILAEAGCCYDVLNNRLGQPIEAPKNCRRRLYYIAWEEGDGPGRTSVSNKKSAKAERVVSENKGVRNSKPKTKKKSSTSDESEVQKTMRSERSFGRRFSRWCVNTAVVVGLVCAGYFGVSNWRSNSGSETFEVANATNESGETESGFAEDVASSDMLASDNFDAKSLNNDAQDDESSFSFITEDENEDFASVEPYSDSYETQFDDSSVAQRPVYVAQNINEDNRSSVQTQRADINSIPDVKNSENASLGYLKDDGRYSGDMQGGLETMDARFNEMRNDESARGGLNASTNGLRGEIVIPDKNNDVFSKTSLY